MRPRTQAGFTVIELAVVLAILAILVMVIVFAVDGSSGTGGIGPREQDCYDRGGEWYSDGRGDYYGHCATRSPG